MILESDAYGMLPQSVPDPKYSFYPYPLDNRPSLHASLRALPKPLRALGGSTPGPSSTSIYPSGSSQGAAAGSSRTPLAGPGPSTTQLKADQRALKRAQRRAVVGRRPAGLGLGREAEDLSEEEEALEDEKQRTNMFGHRFLLPIGRRQTQMEMDTAPSPTPSEADQDRRQEDLGMTSPSPVPQQLDDGEPGGELDLDASLEDLDRSVDDLDGSVEDLDADMDDLDSEELEAEVDEDE